MLCVQVKTMNPPVRPITWEESGDKAQGLAYFFRKVF